MKKKKREPKIKMDFWPDVRLRFLLFEVDAGGKGSVSLFWPQEDTVTEAATKTRKTRARELTCCPPSRSPEEGGVTRGGGRTGRVLLEGQGRRNITQ